MIRLRAPVLGGPLTLSVPVGFHQIANSMEKNGKIPLDHSPIAHTGTQSALLRGRHCERTGSVPRELHSHNPCVNVPVSGGSRATHNADTGCSQRHLSYSRQTEPYATLSSAALMSQDGCPTPGMHAPSWKSTGPLLFSNTHEHSSDDDCLL
ncbi:hypothetical protein WMY93_007736 [Mugilogobius chulae]|uniref:Uncharacterized protein n=1 Tax=Mugilogobius chulae TaxID=88201 RepID=A0AAW0PE07_9GOBI